MHSSGSRPRGLPLLTRPHGPALHLAAGASRLSRSSEAPALSTEALGHLDVNPDTCHPVRGVEKGFPAVIQVALWNLMGPQYY